MGKRYLRSEHSETSRYGVMGELTGINDRYRRGIAVGDLISYRWEEETHHAIVVNYNGKYAPMGLVSVPLDDNTISRVEVIIPSRMVTDDIIKLFHGMKIVETKKMTLSEIEKKLGYPVEIVEG